MKIVQYLVLTFSLVAQDIDSSFITPIGNIKLSIAQFEETRIDILKQQSEYEEEYSELSAKIQKIKDEPTLDFWDRFWLKGYLQNAESLARKMEMLDRVRGQVDKSIDERRQNLGNTLDSTLLVCVAAAQVEKCRVIIREVYRLEKYFADPTQGDRIRFFLNDDEESLGYKSDFNLDQIDRLIRYENFINGQLSWISEQREIWFQILRLIPDAKNPFSSSETVLPISGGTIRNGADFDERLGKFYHELQSVRDQRRKFEAIGFEIARVTEERFPK